MTRIIIIDDEAECRALLEKHVQAFFGGKPEPCQIQTMTDAVDLLNNYQFAYDIIFLDIEMQLSNGMRIAQRLREIDKHVILIFVTKLAQYAVEGYLVDAAGYIIKPARYSSVALVLTKAMAMLKSRRPSVRIMVSNGEGKQMLLSDEIRYIEVLDHMLIYHTERGEYRDWCSLTQREKELRDHGFFRCHRCYLINFSYVTGIPNDGQDMIAIGDDRVPVSRSSRGKLMEQLLGQLSLKAGNRA